MKKFVPVHTGHAEVIRIAFDPRKIEYEFLLEVFFNTHDPTTLNRQGGDIGTQYRSAVFYHSESQKITAEKMIRELIEEKVYKDPIVTEVTPINNYSQAEDYHQEYLDNNPGNPYCQVVVSPKVEKFRKKYAEKLKK
jgi:peptide-methionine (S)-S-oxide reductase